MPSPPPQPLPLPPGLEKDLVPLNLSPQDLPSVERRRVVRPQNADSEVTTPDYMWTIPSAQYSAYPPFAHSDLMIRQEYYNLLAAVLWSLYRQSQVVQLKRDFPQGDQMDVDGSAEEQEVPLGIEPDHLYIPRNPPDIFEETTFPNPFEHPRHGHFYRLGSALIITGLPGIGKTLLLYVIFYLRVAAGLPTAYMRNRGHMLVSTGGRLFVSSLQPQVCSGSDMQAFFNKFGGSARHVYQDSHDLPVFDDLVDASARLLDSKVIHRVMTHTFSTIAVDDSVGHMLITALPLDDEDRGKFRLMSPTPYLEDKLLRQLNANIQMARRELYVINVGSVTPGCKATAGDLLEKHHHGFLALGGKWRLREFTKVTGASSTSKTNLWSASKEDSDWVLEANGKISVFREPVAARPRRQKRGATEFTGLTIVDFPSNVTRLKKDYYYRPSEANFPTFDSFYMDKKGHGFTFQTSEGDKNPHSVKDGGANGWRNAASPNSLIFLSAARKWETPHPYRCPVPTRRSLTLFSILCWSTLS